MAKAIELTIAGKRLRQIVKSTVRHDLHMMNQIRMSGLNGVVKRVDETAEQFSRRLLDELIRTESLVPVVASCFIEADKEDLSWTVESSEQLAKFLNEISDDEGKQVVFSLAVRLVAGFFEAGVASLLLSPSSSSSSQKRQETDPEQSE